MKFLACPGGKSLALLSAVAVASLLTPTAVSAAPAPTKETYSSPGEYLFFVPDGVSQVHATLVSGGGGGGGGGGNNSGSLSGSGGGGGGSSSVVSCSFPVGKDRQIRITVGSGGKGGSAGNGKNNDGAAGRDGSRSDVWSRGYLGYAAPGKGGEGGDASGTYQSGNSSAGGKGGTDADSTCLRSNRKIIPGKGGEASKGASRNVATPGGFGGHPALLVDTCPGSGAAGNGGYGAGFRGGFDPVQNPSEAGDAGRDGCVVLTYTRAS